MDGSTFDRLTRSLPTSRRQMLLALGLAALGLVPSLTKETVAAGCKVVGAPCRNGKQCCSGICAGKKHKKCKAHDTGGCRTGDRPFVCGGADIGCTTSGGKAGACATTTGNAAYCSTLDGDCHPCTKDADCRAFCGTDAACIQCGGFCQAVGLTTACVGTGKTPCNVP
jgi:hypothetical protein